MDDVEDDARYPPNPYPPSHSRPKPPSHPQFPRRFSDQPNSDDEASNSDDIKPSNHQQPPIGSSYMVEDEDDDEEEDADPDNDGDDDDDETSSLESRGKRMKLDNFEFVPRKPPTAMTSASPHPPSMSKPLPAVKSSPPEWSEDSTFVLLESWGDLFVKNGRKSLRSDKWSEVAKKVNQNSRTTRSDSQCRNRVDTLKKKYKKEKARMAEHVNFNSDWIYFKKMDSLMSAPAVPIPTAVPVAEAAPRRLACGVDAGEYIFANNKVYMNRANAMDEMRDSPGDTGTDDEGGEDKDDDESDGLPPTTKEKKMGRGREASGSVASYRMLAESIQKFGEVYERIESSRRKQMVEMERMRKEFHRDLEAQKRQILERAQAEIARIRQEEGEEEERMTGDGNGDDDEEDEIDGSAENLSG